MFDTNQFIQVQGKKNTKRIQFLGLSTCGFCKRAIAFLDENKFSYEYLYVDKLPPEEKKAIVEEFRKAFDVRLHYPTIIIDNEHYEMGFIRPNWEKKLKG